MNRSKLYPVFPILGAAAMVCRGLLYSLCTDSRGLLTPGKTPEILLLILSALALAAAFLVEVPQFKPIGKLSGIFSWLLALAMVLPQEKPRSVAGLLWLLFLIGKYASAAALAFGGFCRFFDKKQPFGASAVVCAGFILRLVASYQVWSRMPQMQDYVFSLLAAILLSAFAYQQSAREAGIGSPLWRLRFGLLGCSACLAAAVGPTGSPFYICAGLWLFVCTLFDPREAA